MATILDLFKSQKEELYGDSVVLIDTRGFVDVPRLAALAASSPKVAADLIGGQISGLLGGSANRPSDTIFKGPQWYRKPITLRAATQAQLRSAVDGDYNTDGGYVVKQNPSPDSVLRQLTQPDVSVKDVATNLAIQGLNKYGSKDGLKELKNVLKTKKPGDELNGSFGAPKYTNKKPFSNYKKAAFGSLQQEYKNVQSFDTANINTILKKESYEKYDDVNKQLRIFANAGIVPVLFKKYGNSTVIPFAGAITGLSEDVVPEWNSFRYIGSPFKIYRYSGVERSLKFNLKLYYYAPEEKPIMIKKINYLKSLAFPYETISTIQYNDANKTSAQIGFSPNLLYVTIGDMYKDVLGYMESLSFSIDDNTPWPTAKVDGDGRREIKWVDDRTEDSSLYPSVIDVSIGIKIIENAHKTETASGTTTTTYNYNFDGRTTEADIVEKKEEKAQPTPAAKQNAAAATTPQEPQFQQGQLNNFTGANGGGYNNMQE